MSDYIEREEAVKVLCDACGNVACQKGLIPRCSYYERMQAIPAADVRHVKRGEWIEKGGIWECSACKAAYKARLLYIKPNFCPNCGAAMREKEET